MTARERSGLRALDDDGGRGWDAAIMRSASLIALVCVSLLPACGRKTPPSGASPAASGSTAQPSQAAPERLRVAGIPAASGPEFPFADRRTPDLPSDARKQPFGIDALYKVKAIGGPHWSPDGKHILFTVSTPDLASGKTETDVYVVGSDGTGLRQMTRFEGPDSDPRWAPDGKSFLFVSTRKDGGQVWQMPIEGGDPKRLTSISTGVEGPLWFGDGKGIVFASRVYPEHGADDKANKAAMDDAEKSTLQAHIADELLFRHWDSWSDFTTSHLLKVDIGSGEVRDLTPGAWESPTFEAGGGEGFALSPDGAELCFQSNREVGGAQAWTTNSDLWVVPVQGGEPRNVTGENKAFDGHPAYSPDGRFVAFTRQDRPGYESDRSRLALYDRQSGKTQILTEGFDSSAIDFKWAKDGRSLVFRAPVQGLYPLFRVSVPDGRIERLPGIPLAMAWDLSPDGSVAFVHSSVGVLPELYAASPQGAVRRLTSFNQPVVEAHDVRPVEQMWIDGAEGRKVHVFVVKPHGFKPGKRYPLVVNVHGGPQMQWADSFRGDWQIYPASGYVVAFPNPHGSTGYGQAYTEAISKDYTGKVHRDVMAVTDALAKLDFVDPERMGAMGWSWGGYYMNWLLGQPHPFKAIASMMGIYDLRSFYGSTEELWFPEWDIGGTPWDSPDVYREMSPSQHAGKFKTPTLIITGEKDYRIPYTESLQLFTALRRRGVPSRLVVFPHDGHWPRSVKAMPLYYAAHLDWFHRYLGGDPSPYDPVTMARGRAFKH